MRMHFQKVLSGLLVSTLALPSIAHAAGLSGVLVGGGVDDLRLVVQKPNGQRITFYCNGACGPWFNEDQNTETYTLKKTLVGARIKLQYQTEKNRSRIAGPDENDTLNFLQKAELGR